MPVLDRLPASLSVLPTRSRPRWSSGTKPKMSAVTAETPSVNAITLQSSDTSVDRGIASGLTASSAFSPPHASAQPTIAPANDRTRPSVISCWSRRQREAPSADRIAYSRMRESARAMSRFARFAHAINRTNATAPCSTSSASRTEPTMSSFSGSIRKR